MTDHGKSDISKLVSVKPLEWENFDAWEFWARSSVGTYYVRERNGIWKTTLDKRSSDALIYEYTTDGLTPNDFEAGRQAAQRDFERRILACLTTRMEAAP